MKTYTAYCVSKRKKVSMKVKQVWKAKSRNHFLYLLEGESPGCDTSLWRAVGKEEAEKIAKELKKPIKLRVSKKKKTKKRSKSTPAKKKTTKKKVTKRAKSTKPKKKTTKKKTTKKKTTKKKRK
jgi:hypothetical protein